MGFVFYGNPASKVEKFIVIDWIATPLMWLAMTMILALLSPRA